MFNRWPWISLRRTELSSAEPKFPAQQLFVLALCRLCEPIAFMSIFPYVYYMVSSFHVTGDDRKIALYAGAVTSAFTFAEFSTGLFWGRVSDRIGRKPVLITGLVGTAISMIVFGFATSLPVAMVARALGGLLNGNIGVLQTTVAELVTEKKHQPRAYSIMPFVWCLGSIIGPAVGGTLAQPCDNYPWFFPRGTLFDRFPFLLPNLVCAMVLGCGIAIGILFLEETHAEKKLNRDIGLQVGQWIIEKFSKSSVGEGTERKTRDAYPCDSLPLFKPSRLPGYQSTQNHSRISVNVPVLPTLRNTNRLHSRSKHRAFTEAFTPQVIFVILGYGILAYHSVSFDQLMPIFLSTPISGAKAELPFKFTGGLGLSTKKVGIMLAIQGLYSMVAQLWLFPFVVRRFGTLRAFRFVLIAWPLLYLSVPYMVLLPFKLQIPAAYLALICKITLHVIAFPSSAILLANSAPTLAVLGSVNGAAASTASLSRAFGPTLTGFLHSKALEWGYSGLAWWVAGLVCLIGGAESFCIKDEDRGQPSESEKTDHEDCEEALQDDSEREPFLPLSPARV